MMRGLILLALIGLVAYLLRKRWMPKRRQSWDWELYDSGRDLHAYPGKERNHTADAECICAPQFKPYRRLDDTPATLIIHHNRKARP